MEPATIAALTATIITVIVQLVILKKISEFKKEIMAALEVSAQNRKDRTDGRMGSDNGQRRDRDQFHNDNRIASPRPPVRSSVENSLRDINLKLKNAERHQEKTRRNMTELGNGPARSNDQNMVRRQRDGRPPDKRNSNRRPPDRERQNRPRFERNHKPLSADVKPEIVPENNNNQPVENQEQVRQDSKLMLKRRTLESQEAMREQENKEPVMFEPTPVQTNNPEKVREAEPRMPAEPVIERQSPDNQASQRIKFGRR